MMTFDEYSARCKRPGPDDVSWIGGLLDVRTPDGHRFYWEDERLATASPDYVPGVRSLSLNRGDGVTTIEVPGFLYLVDGSRGVIHKQ